MKTLEALSNNTAVIIHPLGWLQCLKATLTYSPNPFQKKKEKKVKWYSEGV